MSEDSNLPLSELLRPKTFRELALPDAHILRLQKMLDNQCPANMLLFGPPGTGKTSTARILLKARGDYDHITVDGSKDNGIDYVRKVVEGFTSTVSFTPGPKIVFIDDGDFLSKPGQACLRGLIERSSARCRFIVAVNDVRKVDEAIRSRLLCLHFGVPKAEAPRILKRIQDCVRGRLVELGWSFDTERLDLIVAENLTDLRRMANKVEWAFGASRVPFRTNGAM
jgi:replication-associated recombination protein RarA